MKARRPAARPARQRGAGSAEQGAHGLAPLASPAARPVAEVLRRLGPALRRMQVPAIEALDEDYGSTPFQTLVSTMLSAQTRDAVTLAASLRLFAVADTPARLAALPEKRIERLIYPVSFYRTKAVHVRDMARQVLRRFGGQVPATMEDLLSLPGVGRKTATLVLIVAHQSQDHICVDTHVHRISNRLGWVKTRTPAQTERALHAVTPRRWRANLNLHLVTWGQAVCRPVFPLCGACAVRDLCPRVGVTREGRVPTTREGRAPVTRRPRAAAAAPS